MDLFRWLFGKRAREKSHQAGEERLRPIQFDQKNTSVIDTEGLSPEAREEVYGEIAKSMLGGQVYTLHTEIAVKDENLIRRFRCQRLRFLGLTDMTFHF